MGAVTIPLDYGQIVGGFLVGIAIQAVAVWVGFAIFKALASEWHRQNLERFARIEKALGIDDPDDVAFVRASEGERHGELLDALDKRVSETEDVVREHDGRLEVLERTARPQRAR